MWCMFVFLFSLKRMCSFVSCFMKPSIDSEKHRLLIIRIENEMILLFACCIQGKGKAYKK